MSICSRHHATKKLVRYGQCRQLFVVALCLLVIIFGNVSVASAQTTAQPPVSWWTHIATQVQAVLSVAIDASRHTFSAAVLDIFNPNQSSVALDALEVVSAEDAIVLLPRTNPAGGSLVFNTPVLVDNSFVVTGALSASTSRFTTLVSEAATLAELQAQVARVNDLVVTNSVTLANLSVTNQATVAELVVETLARVAALDVSGDTTVAGLAVSGGLEARGGITTLGANIDLDTGELFASNVVNAVEAGDNVVITGSQNRPVVSVVTDDLVGVLSLNEETGDLELEEGDDIRINGLEIENRSTLFSVTNRGGCVNCIDDTDVEDGLTISGGSINATAIGVSSAAQATFTTTTVTNLLTVSTTATSTFAGSINLTGGCFAFNGSCITGLAAATYVGLTDTPNSLLAGAVQFASTSGSFLTQSADFTFDGTNLTLGADAGLAIDGARIIASDRTLQTLLLGESAGVSNSGLESLIVGDFAGEFNSGDYATILGYGAAGANTGNYTTAIGYLAGYNIAGAENVAIGYQAANDMEGSYNVAIGSSAGLQQTSDYNEFIGYETGRNLSGSRTVLLGTEAFRGAGVDQFFASRNVAIGYQAGYLAETGADNNILLGYRAGNNLSTGQQNIVIGYNLSLATSTSSNTLTIGNLIFGTGLDSTGTTTASGNIGIGTSTPSSRLTVVGDIYTTGAWRDSTNSAGTFGNLLVSTGTSTVWADPAGFGLGDGSYLGLLDTPSSYATSAIQFANLTADALTQASDFVYTGTRLGVGTSEPISTVTVRGDISALDAGAVRFYDATSAGYVGFRASTTVGTSTIWTLPVADGTENQLLVTDGAGNLVFEDISVIGGGATTYLQLTDTPSSFTPYSIPFVNATGTALTQNSAFVFRNESLGLGVNNPGSKLVVQGDVRFQISDAQVGLAYQTATNRFGFGTANPVDLLTVQGGSFTQRGGASGATYSPLERAGVSLAADTRDVAIVGDFAFVVTENTVNEFRVIDIRDPLSPTQVAAIPLDDGATAIAVAGKYAYVTTEVSGDDFHVIDISEPLDPVEVASVPLPTSAQSIALQGRYAYVGTDNVGTDFHVIDISDPLNPFEADAIEIDDSVQGIAVAGNYAYAVSAVQDNDFHVIDISDPTNVVEVGWLGLPTAANAVDVVGRYAYVTTDSDGNDFHIIDISNPSAPSQVSSLNLDASANAVTVTGRYAYVATQIQGNDIYVIDVLNPIAPAIIGQSDLGIGNILGIAVRGRYAFLGSSNTGNTFSVIDISGAEVQALVAGTLSAGEFSVRGDAVVAGTLTGGLGVRAGIEGVQTDGALSVLGSSTSYIAGRLGIGTTTPSAKLTVAGTIQSTSLLGGSVGLEVDANGNIIRGTSDARLKENVSTIEGALDQILALRGVRYEWIDKERFGAQTEIGFLAQEVDVVVPEVVRKGGEYWSLNTRNLLAVVVEAMKEIWETVQGNQVEIEELRERIEYLESKDTVPAAQTDSADAAAPNTAPVVDSSVTQPETEDSATATSSGTSSPAVASVPAATTTASSSDEQPVDTPLAAEAQGAEDSEEITETREPVPAPADTVETEAGTSAAALEVEAPVQTIVEEAAASEEASAAN